MVENDDSRQRLRVPCRTLMPSRPVGLTWNTDKLRLTVWSNFLGMCWTAMNILSSSEFCLEFFISYWFRTGTDVVSFQTDISSPRWTFCFLYGSLSWINFGIPMNFGFLTLMTHGTLQKRKIGLPVYHLELLTAVACTFNDYSRVKTPYCWPAVNSLDCRKDFCAGISDLDAHLAWTFKSWEGRINTSLSCS